MTRKPTYEALEQRVRELEKAGFERQLEEKPLLEQVLYHRVLMDVSLDGIAIIDQEHRVVESNRRFAEMLDYTPEEVLSLHTWDWEAVMSEAEIRANFADLTKTKTTFQTRHRRRDGTIYDAEVTACGAKVGGESMVLTIIRDITDREEAELALKESESRYRSLFENMSDGVAIYEAVDEGEDFFFVGFNEAAERIENVRKEAVLGRRVTDVFPGVNEFGLLDVFRRVWKTGRSEHHPVSMYKDERIIGWRDNSVYKLPSGEILAIYSDQTQSKQAEEALQQEKDLLRRIIETSPAGITIVNHRGRITFANPQAEKVLGLSKKAITERTYNQPAWHITDNDGNPLPDEKLPFSLVMATGQPVQDVRHAIEWLDGRRVFLSINAAPLFTHSGEVSGMVATVEDITERKRAEKALQDSRDMLQIVLDTIPSGVFWKDRNSVYQGANREWLAWAGLSSLKEIIGKNDYDLPWSKKEADSFRQNDGRIMESGIPEYNIIEPYVRADGSQAWAKTNKVPLRDNESHIIGILGTAEDVTARKRAEEELRQQKKRLDSIIEGTNAGTWEWNVQTGETIFNDRWADMIGYKLEELSPVSIDTWMEHTHPDDLKARDEKLQKHFNEELEYYDCECRMRHKNGQWIWILDRGKVISRSKDGRPVWMYGSLTDITDRKRLEEEILKAEKLESLGILAGGLAHDFNNILTTILGNVSMAKYQASPESDIFELLSHAETASKRARSLTSQLLTFAKGGAPVKETASLGDIIKESSLFVMSGSKSICEFSIQEDLWHVDIDVGQISQVINNIVINANQAMPERGVIEITAENLIIDEANGWELKPGRYVRMSFRDEGIGISEKHLSKIFDPYFTTKHAGSGLGLATAYSIINKHGGIITVESRMEIGSTFHIYLPASEKAVLEEEEEKIITGKGKILVMDDQAPLKIMLGHVLNRLGYEPEFAEDGVEAIRMVEEAKNANEPYDAVILDLTIPGGMGGKETIKKLLAIDPDIKAIVSSGYFDDPVMANFQEYGFKGRLMKPFEISPLSKVLHEVIKGE